MGSDEIFEDGRSCPGVNDTDLSSGYSILPLRNGIGLRGRFSISRSHYKRQDRLRPTAVEGHGPQCKGKFGEAKSPGELYADRP